MEKILMDLGLTKTESKIYLLLLKKGNSTAINLAKELKIHRRTIYDNLNILINKGLVTYYLSKNVKFFNAIDPKIIGKIEKEKLKNFQNILPNLSDYFSNQQKSPCVEIIKGIDSIKNIIIEFQDLKT